MREPLKAAGLGAAHERPSRRGYMRMPVTARRIVEADRPEPNTRRQSCARHTWHSHSRSAVVLHFAVAHHKSPSCVLSSLHTKTGFTLPELSNFGGLPGRAGGTPLGTLGNAHHCSWLSPPCRGPPTSAGVRHGAARRERRRPSVGLRTLFRRAFHGIRLRCRLDDGRRWPRSRMT